MRILSAWEGQPSWSMQALGVVIVTIGGACFFAVAWLLWGVMVDTVIRFLCS